ncbi:Digestive cysteine proteinase 3 [Portunus trituberculatus]|uniref:Digestive cysteine proteinase 3 n=1 Tax=Portunus trituberculatus TaxID=210409 RepID=A0A5B7E7D2_PORTR|nr:Digestive cysteine proteinase 3 [Portunus trituberculatus]
MQRPMNKMKAFVLLACTVVLAAATPSYNEWQRFKIQFGKQYRSSQEEEYRKSVFEQNQEFIDNHNKKFEDGLVTFTLKMNQFGDLTTDEINHMMNGYRGSQRRHTMILHQSKEEELPKTVDWRKEGAVTPVKDQKACGSCWAFSTTGSLEGQHFLASKKLVSLSEQNLVDCSDKYGNFGCGGGLMDNAFRYIKNNNGIDTEQSYPYEAKNGPCRFKAGDVGATLTGYVDIQKDSEKDLQHAVAKKGPISVAIDASRPTFHFYSSGIYYDEHCSSTFLDHGVLAVGYGTDSSEYWLVKNSWNESWGDKGYIKMSRNRNNNCGIATQASYPLV